MNVSNNIKDIEDFFSDGKRTARKSGVNKDSIASWNANLQAIKLMQRARMGTLRIMMKHPTLQ